MSARLNGNAPNYGLVTQGDVARRLGVSRSLAYQLEQRALRKIREAVLADPELRDFLVETCGEENIERARDRLCRRRGGEL